MYPTFFPSVAKGLSTKENIKTAEEFEVSCNMSFLTPASVHLI